MVRFSESAVLAIHALGLLAARTELTPLRDINRELQGSEAHLSKVMQRLHKAGFLRATRGPLGGYLLAKSPSEIRLLEVFEVIEGPLSPHSCLFELPVCPGKRCILGALIWDLEDSLREKLGTLTLADLVVPQTLDSISETR